MESTYLDKGRVNQQVAPKEGRRVAQAVLVQCESHALCALSESNHVLNVAKRDRNASTQVVQSLERQSEKV